MTVSKAEQIRRQGGTPRMSDYATSELIVWQRTLTRQLRAIRAELWARGHTTPRATEEDDEE